MPLRRYATRSFGAAAPLFTWRSQPAWPQAPSFLPHLYPPVLSGCP
jgi:hypothetical protein